MMDALRTYLQQYPGLRGGVIHMDSLPMDGRHFSLSSAPCNPILRTYMDGGQRRQLLCLLESRRFFGESIADQSGNLQFLPDLGENRVCLEVSMTTCGYVMDADSAGYGRYQAELKVVYFQGA